MTLQTRIPKGPALQPLYRKMHALSLVGMNYGGVADESCDQVAIRYTGQAPVVFDGGAHLGDYSQGVLDSRPSATVYAFEPAADSYATLEQRFAGRPVRLRNHGLSDHDGDATIYADEARSSSASVMPQERWHWDRPAEFRASGTVKLRTIDSVCEDEGIERIDLLKLDIEGSELAALKGAQRMLAEQRIGLVQFEYGLPAMSARVYLRDFFNLLGGWRICRIVKGGVVPVSYHERFEILWTTNYLAMPI